jgi:hypothetical protein
LDKVDFEQTKSKFAVFQFGSLFGSNTHNGLTSYKAVDLANFRKVDFEQTKSPFAVFQFVSLYG